MYIVLYIFFFLFFLYIKFSCYELGLFSCSICFIFLYFIYLIFLVFIFYLSSLIQFSVLLFQFSGLVFLSHHVLIQFICLLLEIKYFDFFSLKLRTNIVFPSSIYLHISFDEKFGERRSKYLIFKRRQINSIRTGRYKKQNMKIIKSRKR